MPPALTTLAFAVHIGGGLIALAAGLVALLARKGGRLHRRAGNLFLLSMLAMAVFAAYLAVVRPGQIINLFIAAFTLYLIGTAWLTVRRGQAKAGLGEKLALIASATLCVPFGLMIFQIFSGVVVFRTAFKLEGAILIALCVFSAVIAIAAIGDAKVVLSGGITGTPRITRHLWRMCLGLTLAVGSASTNGFARLLPGPYHVPAVFFVPQLAMLAVLIVWVLRVRLTGWGRRYAAAPA